MAKHGLTDKHIATIKAILSPFVARIEWVGLFGSRAQGTHRDYSDIDMVIYGTLSARDGDRLYSLFQDSSLPMTVDVCVYRCIEYPPLKARIDQSVSPLLQRADIVAAQG